jgi:LuxR family transcriptional regulator, maltose regulon positive regulatory protein
VQRNALISALDRHRIWFRFHALFRDFLLAESARRKSVSQRAALLERAATWCFANGHGEDAANYALAAPAPALVAEILESSARGIVSERGDIFTYMDWMARARELGVEVGLESEFWYAWALTFSRRNARARLQASRFERRLLAEPADAPKVADLLRRQELLKMMLSLVSDDMDAAYRGAADWLKAEKARSPIYTFTAAPAAATSMLPEQNYTQVRRNLQIAQAVIGQISSGHSRAWMAVTQALLDLEQGNPGSAEHILMAAQEQVIDLIGPNARMVAMLAMLRARAIFDLGRLDEARSILQDCLTMGAAHGFVETTRHGLEAATALSNGENAGPLGLPALGEIANNGPPRLRRTFMAAQIRRLCALGEAGAAQELADDAEIAWNETGADYLPSEALAITLARIDLMSSQGRLKQAQKLAEQTLREVTTLDRRREMVDLHLTIARLHMLTNDQKSAIRSLSRALALAAPRALVAPFLHHQRILKEILAIARLKDLALTLAEQLKFFRVICEKTGATADAASGAPGASGEIEVLTQREIEMLALLEAGPSNQQIADQLLVSLQTVKWHLYNLYAKLGVRNRAAALAKARSLNLLMHQMP